MFIPLHDANNLKHIKLQYVTIGMIALNVLVFIFVNLPSEAMANAAAIGLGYTPELVRDGLPPPPYLMVPNR